MTAITYTAKRELIAGHILGEVYSLDLPCLDILAGRVKREASEETLSGLRETFLYYRKLRFQITTEPMQASPYGKLDLLIEFLESVSGGESFTFDAYGRVNAPHKPITAILTSSDHDQQAFMRLGQGGRTDYFTIAFSVREL